MLGAYLPTIALTEPNAVVPHIGRVVPARVAPCPSCMGSGVWCSLEDVEQWIDAVAYNEDWVHEQGLCTRMDLAIVRQNVHDLVDTGAPVTLRGEELRQLYTAFLAVRFDAERKLAASGPVVDQGDDP